MMFDFEKEMCDKCLAKYEASDGDCPMSEFCNRCITRMVDWSIDLLGLEGAEHMLRTLEAHDKD